MNTEPFAHCAWHNEPPAHRIDGGTLHVVTGENTDFWRITSYGFIRDNGHFFGAPAADGFTAQVRVRAAFSELYDQAGLMVRIDDQRWIKVGVEFSDGQALLSTVLTNGMSDWAVAPAPSFDDAQLGHNFWLRVTVDAGAIRVQYSADGITWPMLRLAPFPAAARYLVGPMCCTPQRAGLEVAFSEFTLGPALGKDLHDLS
jgi:regulation of enolase protein 1 (concanavalin A-like superfamily)